MWLLATHLASSSQVKAGSSGAVFSLASAREEPTFQPIQLPRARVLSQRAGAGNGVTSPLSGSS